MPEAQPVYELVMRNYLIDIVEPVEGDTPQVRIVTYSVLGTSAEQALHRFFDEQAGVQIYEGDPVDRIMVGVQIGNTPVEGAP